MSINREQVNYDNIKFTQPILLEMYWTEFTFIEQLKKFIADSEQFIINMNLSDTDKAVFDSIILNLQAVVDANPFFKNEASKNLLSEIVNQMPKNLLNPADQKNQLVHMNINEDVLRDAFVDMVNIIDTDMNDYFRLFGKVMSLQNIYQLEIEPEVYFNLDKNENNLEKEYIAIISDLFKTKNPVNSVNQRAGKYELFLRDMAKPIDGPERNLVNKAFETTLSAHEVVNEYPMYNSGTDLVISQLSDKAVNMMEENDIQVGQDAQQALEKIISLRKLITDIKDETFSGAQIRIKAIVKKDKLNPNLVSESVSLSPTEKLLYETFKKLDDKPDDDFLKKLLPDLSMMVAIEKENQNIIKKLQYFDELIETTKLYLDTDDLASQEQMKYIVQNLKDSYIENTGKLNIHKQNIHDKVNAKRNNETTYKKLKKKALYAEQKEPLVILKALKPTVLNISEEIRKYEKNEYEEMIANMKEFQSAQEEVTKPLDILDKNIKENITSNFSFNELAGKTEANEVDVSILIESMLEKWEPLDNKNIDNIFDYKNLMRNDNDIQDGLISMRQSLNRIHTIDLQMAELKDLEEKQKIDVQAKKEMITGLQHSKQYINRFNPEVKDSILADIRNFEKFYDSKNEKILKDIADKKNQLSKSLAQEMKNIDRLDGELVSLRRQAINSFSDNSNVFSNERVAYANNKVNLFFENVKTELQEAVRSADISPDSEPKIALLISDIDEIKKDNTSALVKMKALKLSIDYRLEGNKDLHKSVLKGFEECEKNISADFESRRIKNEEQRLGLIKTNPVVKVNKKQTPRENKKSVEEGLANLKNNCHNMSMLLKEQQNYLDGKDAEKNRARIEKYKNAETNLSEILNEYSKSNIQGYHKLVEILDDKNTTLPESARGYLKEIHGLQFSPGVVYKNRIVNNLSNGEINNLSESMRQSQNPERASKMMREHIIKTLESCKKYYSVEQSKKANQTVAELTRLIDLIQGNSENKEYANLSLDDIAVKVVVLLDMSRKKHQKEYSRFFDRPDTFSTTLSQLADVIREVCPEVNNQLKSEQQRPST